MFEVTGCINGLSMDFVSGKAMLTLNVNEKTSAMRIYDELSKEEKLSFRISKYRKNRSLNANGYMWTLCDAIAKKRSSGKERVTKEDVYRDAIREVGLWMDDEVSPERVGWRKAAWAQIGIGWMSERVDFTPDGNREIIRFYYGSSRYNTKQMSRLIDFIVQECRNLGIETMTPDELEKLKGLWEAERSKNE